MLAVLTCLQALIRVLRRLTCINTVNEWPVLRTNYQGGNNRLPGKLHLPPRTVV